MTLARNRILLRIGRVLADPSRIANFAAARLIKKAGRLAAAAQYEKTVRVLKLCLLVRPNDVDAVLTLIQILAHLQRFDEALAACAKALEVAPDSTSALASLEQILRVVSHSKRPKAVIHALKRCIAANPRHVPAQVALIDFMVQHHLHYEVFDACKRVLELDPQAIDVEHIIREILAHPEGPSQAEHFKALRASSMPDVYHRLVARNVAEALAAVTARFYRDLGVDPSMAPLTQCLNRFLTKLVINEPSARDLETSVLIRFEAAWHQYAKKNVEAMPLFEHLFHDATARRRVQHDPFAKEAVVRAGEILGRHQEQQGNTEAAISIYREITRMDGSSLVARRLALLHARRGHLHEAAKFAEMAILSKPNLFPRLRPNPYIKLLQAEMRATPAATPGPLGDKKEQAS